MDGSRRRRPHGRQPSTPTHRALFVTYRALRALELATYGSPTYAAQQVRDDLLDLEHGDLLAVAAAMAAESELRLTPVDRIPARRRALQRAILELGWRLS